MYLRAKPHKGLLWGFGKGLNINLKDVVGFPVIVGSSDQEVEAPYIKGLWFFNCHEILNLIHVGHRIISSLMFNYELL